MYISFRVNRSSMKQEYNLKGNLIQENMTFQPLWGIYQTKIKHNTHFSLCVTKQNNRSFQCKFSKVNFAIKECVCNAIVGTHRVSSNWPRT